MMDPMRFFSRRSLSVLLLINLMLFALIDGGVYFLAARLFPGGTFSALMEAALQSPQLEAWAASMLPVFAWIQTLFLPATLVMFLILTGIQWALMRRSFRGAVQQGGAAAGPAPAEKAAAPDRPELSEKEIRQQHRRYYLYLLSLLQRRGRLLDFFKEDLSAYADAQIGAAVRSIHKNCAAALDRQVAPRPILEQAEGERVTVPANFDPSAVRLTGNVTGEPPFTGVLRHAGWRAGNLELPVFSAAGDPAVIAPAEVEID